MSATRDLYRALCASGFFASRPVTDIRLAFLSAHQREDAREQTRVQQARDAALVLHLTALLQGEKAARERLWTHLAGVARGLPDDEGAVPEGAPDVEAQEKAAFLDLNEYWVGATPDDTAETEEAME